MRYLYSPEDYYKIHAPKTLELKNQDQNNWSADCPFCGKEGKFYIHKTGGFYQCFVCKEKGSIVKYHAHFGGVSEADAYTLLSDDNEVSLAKEPRISDDLIDTLHDKLLKSELAKDAIRKGWGFSNEAIDHFKLGLKDGYCCFPIYNKQGECVNIRMKKIWPQPGDKYKYRNYTDDDKEVKYSKPRLYPYDVVLTEQEVFLVAGEKDMVSTWSQGIFNVITTTHGEGTFPASFAFDLAGKKVHIVYDIDNTGIIDTKKVYDELKHIADVDVVTLPKMEPYPDGKARKDLTDFWLLGNTKDDLINVLRKVKVEKPKQLDLIRRGPEEFTSLISTEELQWLSKSEPTFIDRYTDYFSGRVNSPKSFHRLCSLWLISNLIGRNCISMAHGYGILPNIWAMVIGPSTGVSKSSTCLQARTLLLKVDKDAIGATSFTPQGLYKRLSQREDDIATAIYIDEISYFFDQIKNLDFMAGAREQLIKVFNCEPIAYEKAKEDVTINRSYTTLLGNGTPTGLAEVLTDNDVTRGLLPRFLVCIERKQMEFQPEEIDTPIVETLEYFKLLDEAKHIRHKWSTPWRVQLKKEMILKAREDDPDKDKNQYGFYMNKKALDRYNEFRRVTEYGDFPNEQIAIAHQRLPMLLRKLSTIYASIDPYVRIFANTAEVNLEHVLFAIRDLQTYRSSMIELINNVGLTPIEKLVNKTIDLVYRRPRITRSEIARELHGIGSKDVDLVISTCIDRRVIRANKLPNGNYEYLVAS